MEPIAQGSRVLGTTGQEDGPEVKLRGLTFTQVYQDHNGIVLKSNLLTTKEALALRFKEQKVQHDGMWWVAVGVNGPFVSLKRVGPRKPKGRLPKLIVQDAGENL